MEHDKRPSYVHKVSDVVLLDSKEDYYPSFGGKHQMVPYKKLVVPSAMRSIYWKCYGFPASENNEILTRNKIVCLLCKSQMIYNRNTSNLRMHLQNKHRQELETLELVQPVPSCKSGRADQRSARRGCKVTPRKRMSDAILSINGQPIEQGGEESSFIPSNRIKQEVTESSLPQFLTDIDEVTSLQAIVKEVTTSETFTLDDGKLIADAVSEFIIMDLQSPEIVEGKGFQRLIATLKSPCEIPSKNRLMDEFIPKIYDSVKDLLIPEINNVQTEISLSIEDWESSCGEIYSTVSLHYVQAEDGEFKTKILSSLFCSELDPLHWGSQFDAMTEEWTLNTVRVKAVIVSSDREEVYDSLIARGFLVIPCLGHIIQAACMDACFSKPKVITIIKKCRALIALLSIIPSLSTILKEQETLIECERGGFQPDLPQLWSTSFTMLEQLNVRKEILPNLYDSISAMGLPVDNLKFDEEEWGIITDITDILSPFKVAMSTLYEERIPLISILKPLIQQLKNVHLEKNKFDSQFALELKSTLSTFIMQRYNDDKVNEILDMSCALDPRFKNLPFLKQEFKEELKDKMRDMVEQISQLNDSGSDTRGSPSKKSRLSGMEYLLGDLCVKSDMPTSQRLNLELVQFECEPPISLDKSPTQYWKDTQGKFPNISKLALQFLCIPVCVNNYLNSHFNSKTANLSLPPPVAHRLRFLHQNNAPL